MKYRKKGMNKFKIPSGAQVVARDYCTLNLGEKHTCSAFKPVHCKPAGVECAKEECKGRWYVKKQGHCKGCAYNGDDPNFGFCFYREYQVKTIRKKVEASNG